MGGPAIGSVVAGALAGNIGATYASYSFAAACLLLVMLVGIKRPGLPEVQNAEKTIGTD